MYYAAYKGIRNSAWQCLADFHVDRFPVDVLRIATSADIHVIKNSMIGDLRPGEYGKSYFNGWKWILIYDDTQPTVVSRFTLAHELGHIFLGHNLAYVTYREIKEFQNTDKPERQADAFAERILCPSCILWKYQLHTATEIAQCCRVPMEIAKKRAQRMKALYRREMFLTDPLEQRLYRSFQPK